MHNKSFILCALSLAMTAWTSRAELLRFEGGNKETGLVPGVFVYNPMSGESLTNSGSRYSGEILIWDTGLSRDSDFTMEAFARPVKDLNLKPGDAMSVMTMVGGSDRLWMGIRRSNPPHSYPWWQAGMLEGKVSRLELRKARYKGASMVQEETPWRHLAITWNEATRTISFYLDYQLQERKVLATPPAWDPSRIQIGGGDGFLPFQGHVDEIRVHPDCLEPWEFLRPSEVALENVRFGPEDEPTLPEDFGQVNVRLHYGAVGDGIHDDTEAIRRAFAENESRVPIEYKTVYFPAGTYRITDMIRFSRFMVVRGAGRDKTRIVLEDRAKGYQDPKVPRAVFAVGYDWPYTNRSPRQKAGNAIGSYIFDLSIDSGHGNPSALGLDFHCNNVGAVEGVDIRSGDGAGLVGLDFKRGWPGPCLIRDVSITGFEVGIDAAYREYSLVFSNVRLVGQGEVAIRNRGNVLSMEDIWMEGQVPALWNESGGLVTLIRSRLQGRGGDYPAINSRNGSLYLRDVECLGFASSLRDEHVDREGKEIRLATRPSGRIGEYFTGPEDSAVEVAGVGSLKLDIHRAPVVPRPALESWVNVRDFSHLVSNGDWAGAIQAAVDSGAELVYFPADETYVIGSDVILRGKVRTFLGTTPKTGLQAVEGREAAHSPALVLDPGLPVFQFDMFTADHVRHPGATDLIFRHAGAHHISASEGCGRLFIEDTGGKWRFNRHQRVWGRQLNPETKNEPEIINDGGQLWILGMKTEYLSTKIVNRNGARTELLGGLMYPVHPVEDETLPMFLNEDSEISLVHAVSVYKKNHKTYMREIRSGQVRDFNDWRWIGGRPIINLYRSLP